MENYRAIIQEIYYDTIYRVNIERECKATLQKYLEMEKKIAHIYSQVSTLFTAINFTLTNCSESCFGLTYKLGLLHEFCSNTNFDELI